MKEMKAMKKIKTHPAGALLTFIVTTALWSCGSRSKVAEPERDRDTLHVATLYSPTSYFNYRGQDMGFDYENIRQFADSAGYVMDLKVASNLQELLDMLDRGEADVAAYPVPRIGEYTRKVLYCGPKEVTWQVLVQPDGREKITDVTQLVGKEIYVEKDSKYHYRMNNLNAELGGGLIIKPISRDTLISEDLIEMVHNGEIPLTVVDSDVAELNKSYYPDLDISMKVSLDQMSGWAVSRKDSVLAREIDTWNSTFAHQGFSKNLYKKYFENSKVLATDVLDAMPATRRSDGSISPYDHLFQRHSAASGRDWEMLAAIGYVESRFRNDVSSWAGAKGIMQIMPGTARALGYGGRDMRDPDVNIGAGAALVAKLDKSLQKKIADPDERIKFVLAAYNSGLGHVLDGIALAAKYGYDPTRWEGHVSEAILMKSNPKYYNDPVVKNGYFRGRETVNFVETVMRTYNGYRK